MSHGKIGVQGLTLDRIQAKVACANQQVSRHDVDNGGRVYRQRQVRHELPVGKTGIDLDASQIGRLVHPIQGHIGEDELRICSAPRVIPLDPQQIQQAHMYVEKGNDLPRRFPRCWWDLRRRLE